jgi:glycosyltransferase involved in cell wall biosynthesis
VAAELARFAPKLAIELAEMPILLAPPDVATARTAWPSALFVGLIRRYKGVEVLLDAWSRARLSPEARLTIAGESYLGAGKLEGCVDALGARSTVTVVNRWLTDAELWASLLRSHVLVLPYLQASQSGLVPLGLAAGLRIIASDAGGIAESLSSRRHTIVKAGDRTGLALALEETLGEVAEGRADAPQQEAWSLAERTRQSWNATVLACERAAWATAR